MKGITGQFGWAMVSVGLMCFGLGGFLKLSSTAGVFIILIGLAAGYFWYTKFGKQKKSAPPTSTTTTPTTPTHQPLDKEDRR